MTSKTFNPDFYKVDLVALYATMYLKRIVVEKLPWKQHLFSLYEEVKENMKKLGKEKEQSLFSSLREYARMYNDQWISIESENESNEEMYYSLLFVLTLMLGQVKLWVPVDLCLREDVTEVFFDRKPSLKLKYLSQAEFLYDSMAPLCSSLEHVSVPFADKTLFTKAVGLGTLRVLEFSTGVSDKVICHALWNIDKKSNKVLQAAIKDKKEGRNFLALPHLEVLRSNIQMSKNAFGSMRVTLGAAALVIQPKLRIVENRFYWSTLQAIQVLLEYEERYKVKHERRLAVDRLLIPSVEWPEKNLYSNLPLILEMCPKISSLTFTDGNLRMALNPLYTSLKVKLSSVKELCVDATDFTIDDFWPFISELGSNLKHLTLRVTFSLIVNFYVKKKSDDSLVVASRNVETLSIIFSDSEEKTPFDPEVEAKAMTSFLVCFPELKTIRYYNLYHIPPLFAVYGCVAGALACIPNLQHLSLSGSISAIFGNDIGKIQFRNEVNHNLPSLMDTATFNVLKKLKSLTIDSMFLNNRVDRFLDMLRTCEVHVKVKHRPFTKKGIDPAYYFDCDEFLEIYGGLDFFDDSLF
ncbi:UNVERIFIED_CONTAM: hypothetical protein RMT77_011374 [Armadillidium vulgare]